MAYRTKLAQKAYKSILHYIRGNQTPQDKAIVADAINALTKKAMMELSINSDSHLTDILHISYVINKQNPTETCKYLLNLLLIKARSIDNETFTRLRIYPNNAGFTPCMMH